MFLRSQGLEESLASFVSSVQYSRYYISQPVFFDAVALINCQWVIRGFELNQGPEPYSPLMHHCLKKCGVLISRNFRAEPAKVRAEILSAGIVPMLRYF